MQEFEQATASSSTNNGFCHQEEVHSLQLLFAKDVRALDQGIREKGNPFLSGSAELITLNFQWFFEPEVAL